MSRARGGQFISKKRRTFGFLVVLVLIIIAIYAINEQGRVNEQEVNDYTCAVWGYKPDCVTQLK